MKKFVNSGHIPAHDRGPLANGKVPLSRWRLTLGCTIRQSQLCMVIKPNVTNFVLPNRCRCQSITQQYLKICLIKNANNYMYMFRSIATIIRLSFESMVEALIGLIWLCHEISPSSYSHTYPISATTILSNKNLTMAAIGRNMYM